MKTKNRVTLIIIVGLLVILAILSSRLVFAKANLQDTQGFQTIQRPTATPMSWVLLEIQRLEHNLQYGKFDDYTRQNLRAILTETWLEATQEVEFRITTPQKPPPFTDIPIPTSEYIYLGITTPIPSTSSKKFC
jgi:hypothetical protein